MGMDHNRNHDILGGNPYGRVGREMVVKSVMSITELVNEGYPESRIRKISRSDDFPQVGFSTGKKRKTYYFHREKLDKYLERKSYEY